MATPLFNAEIVKLRRRLGDLFATDGTEITTANVESADGSIFKRLELVDIYNDAVRKQIDYVLSVFPKERWYEYIPGYIFLKTNVSLTSNKYTLSTADPKIYRVIDVRKYTAGTPAPNELAVEINPAEYFPVSNGLVKTRLPSATSFFWTVMAEGTAASHIKSLYLLGTISAVDILYVRQHDDISHGGSVDMDGISTVGLAHIQLLAESIARKYKTEEITDLPEIELKNKTEFDLMINKK